MCSNKYTPEQVETALLGRRSPLRGEATANILLEIFFASGDHEYDKPDHTVQRRRAYHEYNTVKSEIITLNKVQTG